MQQKIESMAFSYNFKHASEVPQKQTKSTSGYRGHSLNLSGTQAGVLAGSIFLGLLLLWSWSLGNLFMTELLTVTAVWLLVSLVKLQSEPKKYTR